MSPHGDLIAFGFFVLAATVPPALVYLSLRYAEARERRRHNLAVENYNRAILRAIRRLGSCDGGRS